MKKLFTLALMCMMMFVGFAQDPGTLDETYGNGGTVVINPTQYLEENPSVLVQKDGKILIVSNSRKDGANYYICVTRQNPDGSIDETYGENGYAFFQQQMIYKNAPIFPNTIVLGEDGQLYIASKIYSDEVVSGANILCVDENGFINTNFGENGWALCDRDGTEFHDIAIDSQGRIYVAGFTGAGIDVGFVQRYTPDGKLDTSWADNGNIIIDIDGRQLVYIDALTIVEDDKVLLGGIVCVEKTAYNDPIRDPRLWKLNQDGSFDTSFGNNGCFTMNVNEINAQIWDIELQSDGKYIVSGYSEIPDFDSDNNYGRTEVFVTRVTMSGELDGTFGDNGITCCEIASGSGCLNECFDIEVAHDDQIFGVVFTKDYVQNRFRQYAYNLNADGTFNEDFAGTGIVPLPWTEYPNGQALSLDIQKDGKVVVVGWVDEQPTNPDWVDINLISSRINTSVAPQQGEEVGTSEVAIEIGEITATTVELTFTPNEHTTEYFYGLLPKDQYEEYGEEFCVDYLYEYGMPTTGSVAGVMEDLEAETAYVVLAFGFNSEGERGTVTTEEFTTKPTSCAELNDIQFTVYPNPATTVVYVTRENDADAQVTILDVTGRCVKSVVMTENMSSINIDDVESGVYFIMVQQEGNSSVRKLVVK